MLDVSQIMKDLASMVHEQGETIGKTLFYCFFSLFFLKAGSFVLPDSVRKVHKKTAKTALLS